MLTDATVAEVTEAVEIFNSRYAEMERVLWCLSRAAADDLLARKRSPVIEEFVWTIKSWWGIQGVRKETKAGAAAALLASEWSPGLLEPTANLEANGEKFAIERVAEFVEEMNNQGVPRREWSLASKVLHWLMPWRIPVYDSFVKHSLAIADDADPDDAYRSIVRAEFRVARRLLQEDRDWLGDVEPRSPFRALDKYLWRLGGGSADRAVVVNDPWRTVRLLGLKRP